MKKRQLVKLLSEIAPNEKIIVAHPFGNSNLLLSALAKKANLSEQKIRKGLTNNDEWIRLLGAVEQISKSQIFLIEVN